MSACAMTIAASTSTTRRLATSRSASCLELSSLKMGAPFSTSSLDLDVNLAHAAVCFRQNRNGAKKGRHAGCGWMVVEDDCDQEDRQHQTSRDAPSQFEPYRVQRDLPTDPLVLHVAPVEIVGNDREQGAQDEFQHDLPLRLGLQLGRLGGRAASGGVWVPDSFSTEAAMRLSGVWKSGRSMSASSRPATQKACTCVNSDSRPRTATISNWNFLCPSRSGSECSRKKRTPSPNTVAMTTIVVIVKRVSVSPGAVMNHGR